MTFVVSLSIAMLAASGDKAPSAAVVSHCLVSAIDEVDVPAKEAGQLVLMEAKEGMVVETGTVLAQIDDEPAQRQKEIATREQEAAQAKADNDVAVRHAQSSAKVAEAEFDDAVALNKRGPGTLSQSEVRKRRLQFETAQLQIEQAEFERQVNSLVSLAKAAEVAASETAIARRRVVAPISGVIAEVPKQAGEWVQPGDRVARLVRLDRLRVEGFVRGDEYHPYQLDGQPVFVEVALPRGKVERFEGKIVFTHPKLEADGEFRVWAEVVNRRHGRQWLLRPGAKAEMTIELTQVDEAVEEVAEESR